MSYCTLTDLQEAGITPAQLVQLTDDDADGVADADVIAKVLANTDSVIDGYLGSRYTVPVAPVPNLLRTLATVIAAWALYGRRGLANERRQKDFDSAIVQLKDLAAGRMVLPASAGGEVASDGSDLPEASTVESDRIFTRGKPSSGESGTLDNF
jgi:phage gp36-like protein